MTLQTEQALAVRLGKPKEDQEERLLLENRPSVLGVLRQDHLVVSSHARLFTAPRGILGGLADHGLQPICFGNAAKKVWQLFERLPTIFGSPPRFVGRLPTKQNRDSEF